MESVRSTATALVLAAVVLGLSLAGHAAEQVTIETQDGRTLRGQLIAENPQTVTLRSGQVVTVIERQDIQQIIYPPTLRQQYLQRRADIAEGDLAARYELALWLFDADGYELAQEELGQLKQALSEAPSVDPALERRVNILSQAVDQRLKLQNEVFRDRAAPPRPEAAGPAAVPEAGQTFPATLTDEQINRIKVYEVDLTTRPQVRIPKDVIDKIFSLYADRASVPRGAAEQRRFRTLPGWEQLRLLFELQARQFYGQVQVAGDPPAMQTFRSQIHQRYALAHCASAGCHGGPDAQVFRLITDPPNRIETVYTNFFILNQTQTPTGYMIDRAKPSRSLLIQHGLPRDLARLPHPEVPGWRPIIRDTEDPLYQTLYNWIDQQLYSPAPDYGVQFTLPGAAPQGREESSTPAQPPEQP